MRAFVPEPLIFCITAAIILLTIVYLVAKYTYYFNSETEDSGESEINRLFGDSWYNMKNMGFVVPFIILMSNALFITCINDSRKTLTEIKKEQISPVKATARVERKIPYGIRIYLQDAAHSTYQFDLEDTSLNKEFIEKVNSGYTVSKLRNSTDILLTNGNDSIYYNLYY